tara:strand:+ start:60283 stop:61350 length:1068 start_codon:yes stop_codon:yes gene_type:complete
MPNSVLALVLAACLPTGTAWAAAPTPPSASPQPANPQSANRQSANPQPANRGTGKQDPVATAKAQITEVIALEFAQASAVAKTVSRSLKLNRRSAGLVLIPHPSSNAILLRGSAKRIAEAKDLIARADVQPAFQMKGAMTQIVTIEHGKAQDIADTLNRFLQTSRSDDLRIEAHAPNNMLLLRGTKQRLLDSLELIAQLDRKPSKPQVAPRIVYLEHTKAGEVAATLNRFLDLGQRDGPNRGFFIDANKPRNAVILRGTAQQVSEAIDLIARMDVKTPGKKNQTKRQVVVLKHAQAKDIADTLKSFAGRTTEHAIDVSYSKKQNALLLQGTEEKMRQVLNLIARLDIAPAKQDAK